MAEKVHPDPKSPEVVGASPPLHGNSAKTMLRLAMPSSKYQSRQAITEQNLAKLAAVVQDADVMRAKFKAIQSDMKGSPFYVPLQRDSDANVSWLDHAAYNLENLISSEPLSRFYILTALCSAACFVYGVVWIHAVTSFEDTESISDAVFMSVQVILTGGYEGGMPKLDQKVCFVSMVVFGIVLVSTLIGLITDAVGGYMDSLSAGSTKVVERNHTLILGWNESTLRVLCQIAFLRRVYFKQNETVIRRMFPWYRVPPSSPVAHSTVVVMNNTMDKEVMEDLAIRTFSTSGIRPKRTKVGRDVIFRKGDPCVAHDLVRVGAHRATAVLVMLTDTDDAEEEEAKGNVENSATLRCCLALRSVIYSNDNVDETFNRDLRVVVELGSACDYMDEAAIFSPTGRKVTYPLAISRNINSILFYCASKPGLSRVLMNLYNFQGVAIRCRSAAQLKGGHQYEVGWFVGKTVREAALNHSWCDGILIGIDDSAINQFDEKDDNDGYNAPGAAGIMGDPDRVINIDDTVIFVSETSSPNVSKEPMDKVSFLLQASPFMKAAAERRDTLGSIASGEKKMEKPTNLLLCGWRHDWDTNILLFKARVRDIAMGMAAGSTITCANIKSHIDFKALLEGSGIGFVPTPGDGSLSSFESSWQISEPGYHGVIISHFCGNPTKTVEMAPLLETKTFNVAICLGSVVGAHLGSSAMDSRVLSMLLILRKLTKDASMHIIAENFVDQTSALAVVPQKIGAAEPDFVNTIAIKSRSLAMTLAYPQIQDALSELIISLPNSPEVNFVSPSSLNIEGKALSFGAVQHILSEAFRGRAIAIGFFKEEQMELCPRPGLRATWDSSYRFIIIMRRTALDPGE